MRRLWESSLWNFIIVAAFSLVIGFSIGKASSALSDKAAWVGIALTGIGGLWAALVWVRNSAEKAESRRTQLLKRAQRLLGLRLVNPLPLHELKEVDPSKFGPLIQDARRLAPKDPGIDLIESFALAVQGKGEEAESRRRRAENSGDPDWTPWAEEARDALKAINDYLNLPLGSWEEVRQVFENCPEYHFPDPAEGLPLRLFPELGYCLGGHALHNGETVEVRQGDTWRRVRLQGMPAELRGYDGPDDDTGRELDPGALYRRLIDEVSD